MNKILIGFIVFASFVFFSVQKVSFDTKENMTPSEIVEKNFRQRLELFVENTEKYNNGLISWENTPQSTLAVKENYLQLRKSFKSIEYIAEYLDPEFVRYYINGAPLPRLAPDDDAMISVIEPVGFQISEELLFDNEPFSNKEELQKYGEMLTKRAKELKDYQSKLLLSHRKIFEATRVQLIRIMALGISGFDSPAQHSIPDALISLSVVSEDFMKYKPMIEAKSSTLAIELDKLFSKATSYLSENNDFDTFDRAYFIREFINPLYSKTLEAQQVIGIETIYETQASHIHYPVNYNSKEIFDKDFFDELAFLRTSPQHMTDEVADLGKMLFFDPVLSSNNERACASCHIAEKGFTDKMQKSIAMDFEGTVNRNAPTLLNATYAARYFYDLRTEFLEDQIDHVVTSHQEFRTSFMTILSKLKQSSEYRELFKKAFPDIQEGKNITKYTLTASLAVYVASLSSFDSEFDRYMRKETETIEQEVLDGFNLFMGKAVCGTCHFAPSFNGLVPPLYAESESEILGVPATNDTINPVLDPDRGRKLGVLKEDSYIYDHSFKTTSVRNVAITAPYMHNGVYATLEEVVDFYNKGGGQGLGFDLPNQTLPFDSLALSEKEQKSIVAFMNALTDTTGLTSKPSSLPRFENKPEWNKRKIGGEY